MQVDQSTSRPRFQLMLRHIAVPNEHGSWVFLFCPLLIGIFAGGSFRFGSLLLVGAALAAFMLRQPITILVKILSKRRPRNELPVALSWIAIYGVIALGFLSGLMVMGFTPILFLAVPALPVFAWHLWLVSRRSERRQPVVEIAGSGVLALVAPAAYWVGTGQYDPMGWLLWGLAWMQAGVSIYYAYLRLQQRVWIETPEPSQCWQAGRTIVLGAGSALILVILMAFFKIVPLWLPLAFGVQFAEALWGTFRPAVKAKPTHIGIRQLIVSTLFTIIFIAAWLG